MDILKDRYTITELSQYLNITDHALRFYEKEFNLNIPKDARGRRFYTTDNANIMYNIKTMRDEGLEIKAIRNILKSEHIIEDKIITNEEKTTDLMPFDLNPNNYIEMKQFFNEFRDQIISSVSGEVTSAKEQLSKEVYKTKLELGACVENSIRRLETKMERHFNDVDSSLSKWREKKKKKGIFR